MCVNAAMALVVSRLPLNTFLIGFSRSAGILPARDLEEKICGLEVRAPPSAAYKERKYDDASLLTIKRGISPDRYNINPAPNSFCLIPPLSAAIFTF